MEKMSHAERLFEKYVDYFETDEKQKAPFIFEAGDDKEDKKFDRTGFLILLSNKFFLGSSDALKIYRKKGIIEKNFDQLNNRLDLKHMRTPWNILEGKLFIGFLALILRSDLQHKIKSNDHTKDLTFGKVLIELRKIKSVILADQSEALIPLTEMQETILAALDVSVGQLGCQ